MKIEEIKPGEVYAVVAANIHAAISGAWKAAFYPDGRVTLVYTDNTTETASFTIPEAQAILDAGMDNWFGIVSAVQSKRQEASC